MKKFSKEMGTLHKESTEGVSNLTQLYQYFTRSAETLGQDGIFTVYLAGVP